MNSMKLYSYNTTLFRANVCAMLVAYGRIIGDDAFALYIQDIMVKPDYQSNGIRMAIMTEIMTYIKETYDKGFDSIKENG